MTKVMKRTHAAAVSLVAAAAVCAYEPAMAHSIFDGTWNVLFVTEMGQCGPPFRQNISIVDGSVVSPVNGAHDMIGRVDRDGTVRVSMYRAAEHAFGSGRLRSNFGSGVWKGLLSAHRCSGRWQAERH